MKISLFLKYFLIATFGISMGSCKKDKSYTTISLDSMLSLVIQHNQGDNIDPFTNETFDFVGFPGAIAYIKNEKSFPFLVLGKDLETNHSYSCHFIASIQFELDNEKKLLGIALPIEGKFRSVNIESFDEMNIEYASLKLWLEDYLTQLYRNKHIRFIQWGNETEIFRKLIENK